MSETVFVCLLFATVLLLMAAFASGGGEPPTLD